LYIYYVKMLLKLTTICIIIESVFKNIKRKGDEDINHVQR